MAPRPHRPTDRLPRPIHVRLAPRHPVQTTRVGSLDTPTSRPVQRTFRASGVENRPNKAFGSRQGRFASETDIEGGGRCCLASETLLASRLELPLHEQETSGSGSDVSKSGSSALGSEDNGCFSLKRCSQLLGATFQWGSRVGVGLRGVLQLQSRVEVCLEQWFSGRACSSHETRRISLSAGARASGQGVFHFLDLRSGLMGCGRAGVLWVAKGDRVV